jgi:hypothetical protein
VFSLCSKPWSEFQLFSLHSDLVCFCASRLFIA